MPNPATQRFRVLFLCTGNSCRSQIAEGWARALKADALDAHSAGTNPHGLNPLAVRAMREAGVDISTHTSKTPADLAHYARACVDILCEFPFGTEELEGIAARGDFDLSAHQTPSTKSQEIFDEELKAAAAKLTDE